MLQKLLETVHWLNAEPGRKRGVTLALVALGQLLRQVGRFHGVDVGGQGYVLVLWVIDFVQTDMVPLVDLLTVGLGAVSLWHPVSKVAANAVGVPPPTEVPVVKVPESFQTAAHAPTTPQAPAPRPPTITHLGGKG